MRNIIVSIGVLPLSAKEYGRKVSIRELFSLYPEVKSDLAKGRCAAIIKYAQGSVDDFFVESAISSLSDYTCLKEGLLAIGESISRVIVCYPTPVVDKEYKQKYQQHARWMDYSPEAAEQIAKDHIKSLQELVEYIKQDGVEVEVISTELS